MYKQINEAYKYIFEQYSHPIDIAIILGSGLGPLADEIENPVIIDYQDIPFFPKSTIPGHEGKLYIGKIAGKTVCAMKGRFHYYEGHDMDIVTFLYSDSYLDEQNPYHFDHWLEKQFYCDQER